MNYQKTSQETLKEIKNIDWSKNWSGKFSILISSFSMNEYINICKKYFGVGFKKVFYLYKEGIISCYLPQSEIEKFSKNLVKIIENDPNVIKKWNTIIKNQTDLILKLSDRKGEYFLDTKTFSHILKNFSILDPYLIANKLVADFLPKNLSKRYLPELESARKYSEPVHDLAENLFIKIAQAIAQKEKCSKEEVLSMHYSELLNYFKNNVLPKDLKKRHRGSVWYLDKNKIYLFSDNVEKIEKSIFHKPEDSNIKGKPAYPGKIKGICRIVLDPRKETKFKKGEILVTSMTRPDYLPLMEKASAFITDAGGVLCHAAIVAREMKKPCIIGTEIATKYLKDGNLIEVDANKGTVIIIK